MSIEDRFDELGLEARERELVEQLFGAGRTHPMSDELIDETTDLLDRAALRYLKTRRDSRAIEMLSTELKALLDKVILERYHSLCDANRDIHEYPPYYTADRWPGTHLSTVRRVIEWAFRDRA